MHYKSLPNTDLEVSTIGLGSWLFGGGYDWGDFDKRTAEAAVLLSVDKGVNFIDTAPIYGNGASERFLGEVLKGKRNKVVLATKCGLVKNGSWTDHDLSPKSIQLQLENSLLNLRTDYIDLYQIHYLDSKVPLESVITTLLKYKKEGKIRHIGICNINVDVAQEIVKFRQFVCIQNEFSLLHPYAGVSLASFCEEHNAGFVAYGSLCGGILSGKYKNIPNFRRADARNYFYKCYKGDAFCAAQKTVANVKQLANDLGVSPSSVALAWILHHPFVTSALCGMRSAAHVNQNLEVEGISLSESQINFLQGSLC